ncbi:response regulator [Massilia sp. W12]|uniref:response regulator n=1 Tax=Massilia sp. W12 TaxID=3126507 RepID=UPI0030CB53B1
MPMRVLVVDDDSISRMVLLHLLGSLGVFDVIEAEDGQVAWEYLSRGEPVQLLFCDGRMPRLSGMDLLQKMRAAPPLDKLPFVFMSASEDEDTVQHALQSGANAYVIKPFVLDDVRRMLEQLVREQWRDLIEAPGVSLRRLQLQPAQLQGYLQAFEFQLEQTGREWRNRLDAAGSLAQEQGKINSVQQACQTLGLHYAAQICPRLSQVKSVAALQALMTILTNTVEYQIQQLRELQGRVMA